MFSLYKVGGYAHTCRGRKGCENELKKRPNQISSQPIDTRTKKNTNWCAILNGSGSPPFQICHVWHSSSFLFLSPFFFILKEIARENSRNKLAQGWLGMSPLPLLHPPPLQDVAALQRR
jgi:hypothetical protein